MRHSRWWLSPVVGLALGCLERPPATPLVPVNPFESAAPQPALHVSASPAATEVAARVDGLGRRILAANPQLGVRPVFRTIGAPQQQGAGAALPEIFHRGTAEVVITESLVRQCAADERLAAVLCHELGRMIAEREALAALQARTPERDPPLDVPVGNNNGSMMGDADRTHLAELAKFGGGGNRRRPTSASVPDPKALARMYLHNTGYEDSNLDAVLPLVHAAEKNSTMQKQMLASPR
jgi:hypothetical protein